MTLAGGSSPTDTKLAHHRNLTRIAEGRITRYNLKLTCNLLCRWKPSHTNDTYKTTF